MPARSPRRARWLHRRAANIATLPNESARRVSSLTKHRGAPLVPVAGADMPADIAHALRLLSACGRRAFMLTNWARRDFGAL